MKMTGKWVERGIIDLMVFLVVVSLSAYFFLFFFFPDKRVTLPSPSDA